MEILLWTMVMGVAVVVSGQEYYYTPQEQPIVLGDVQYSDVQREAVCHLVPAASSEVTGIVNFVQRSCQSPVEVYGTIDGLTPGKHGFHIHQIGSITNECKDAGSHFNPLNRTHGDPSEENRHAGDFGNIEADSNGRASFHFINNQASLQENNPHLIIGKSIVVHANEDDLGRGGNEESLKTGNAGARIACCVITVPTYY